MTESTSTHPNSGLFVNFNSHAGMQLPNMAHWQLSIVTFLLALSFSNAANFTTVYNWEQGMDYVWPSDAIRTKALADGTFQPEKIWSEYMAVHEKRLFLSLYKNDGIPVTLVFIPTSSASSVSPKLTPFPSWHMHDKRNYCSTIQAAKGLEVDAIGRLWVLDDGSKDCGPKLRIFTLANDAQEHFMHEFSLTYNQGYNLHDLVLDKTHNNGYFAYITRKGENHIVVFSLEKNESWTVNTLGIKFFSIAFSPKAKEKPAQLYLSDYYSNKLCSFSVAILRNQNRDVSSLTLIGEWTKRPYRMSTDSNGTMYAAFFAESYISTWKISQPFQEHRLYEVGALDNSLPFSFSLDSSGILWMTERKRTWGNPEYTSRLLKMAVGSKSYIFDSTEATPTTVPLASNTSGRGRENKNCDHNLVVLNVVLSCWNVFCLFSIASQILWYRKLKRSTWYVRADRAKTTNNQHSGRARSPRLCLLCFIRLEKISVLSYIRTQQ
ncbi:Hypothetical predicted protein [Cloeon dipterum]|uniref:Bee-milk protein n=1 Tax=Cloeon dipterum TaxID=197152 RepID=A0A8S1DG42_9INSE|nr:Hypothetical predicted protein [Cloeon dipterum]